MQPAIPFQKRLGLRGVETKTSALSRFIPVAEQLVFSGKVEV
jgi:hypothetical protein